ncbi:MAG TPA: host attachment family protein [Allosphingosinicella sp.]|jgi:protein required for attachment to host cells
MQIPHNAYVLVADGRKLLFFRNEGDSDYPKLEVEVEREEHNPDARDQGTDEPGRTFSGAHGGDPRSGGLGATVGAARSAYSETDFHQLQEDRFAHEAADMLKQKALANEYDRLIVVAPPKTLGEMRKHYHKEVESRIAGELAKDLTNMPVDEIERILQAS